MLFQNAFHLDFIYIRQWLAIERSILRLPRDCVGTVAGDDVRGREFLPVGQGRVCLDNPLVTRIAPGVLADGAVCHKTPRAYLRGGWIPTDPLRSTRYQGVSHRRVLC
jgi:hypothetical protein